MIPLIITAEEGARDLGIVSLAPTKYQNSSESTLKYMSCPKPKFHTRIAQNVLKIKLWILSIIRVAHPKFFHVNLPKQ